MIPEQVLAEVALEANFFKHLCPSLDGWKKYKIPVGEGYLEISEEKKQILRGLASGHKILLREDVFRDIFLDESGYGTWEGYPPAYLQGKSIERRA